MTMTPYGSVVASQPSQQVVHCPRPRPRTTSKFGRISSHRRSNSCTQPQLTRTSATTLPFPRLSLSPQPNSTATPRDGERNAARLAAKGPHAWQQQRLWGPERRRRSLHSSCDPRTGREKKKRRRRSHRRSGSTSTNNNQTTNARDYSSA